MFDGSEGALITIDKAKNLVDAYRDSFPNRVKGLFLGKDILEDLLNQQGAEGIRVYLGEENNDFTIVCVAADENEDDIIGKIADSAVPCPTNCSSTGRLK